MPSRPQFSLRRLLVVILFVCLAAATLNEPPEDQPVMRGAQALLRAVLCVAFAAAMTVRAMRTNGYRRSFYIGGATVAALPLLALLPMVESAIIKSLDTPTVPLPGFLLAGIEKTSPYRWWFAKWWVSVPGFGLAAIAFDWMFRINARANLGVTLAPRQLLARGALFVIITILLCRLAITTRPADARLVVLQSWLEEGLCVFFAAALTVGAVQGWGYFRNFCIGGLLPALPNLHGLYLAAMFWGLRPANTAELSEWILAFVLEERERRWLAANWPLIPVVGAAFVFFDWLFRRGARRPECE